MNADRDEAPFLLRVLKLWFGLRQPVDVHTYRRSVLALLAIKFGTDVLLVWWATGAFLHPLAYLSPFASTRLAGVRIDENSFLLLALGPLALPFVWAAISLTMRRAADAGLHPLFGLGVLVPVSNVLLVVLLCVLPTQERPDERRSPALQPAAATLLLSAVAGAVVAVAMVLFSVMLLGTYGSSLFVGAPFALGCVTGFLYNRAEWRGVCATQVAVQVSLGLVFGALLLFALEGVVCIAMVYPLAAVIAGLGGLLGAALAVLPTTRSAHIGLMLLAWPLLTGAEMVTRHAPLRSVVSSVEIDAPPEAVWPQVVGFSDLPPPTEWVFWLGIAHPKRARIEGHGVGAIRYCEFSTGAFVEPVTVWEEPTRLAFDVAETPPPMREWSPYETVHAPHLAGNMRSRHGEFRLVPLPGGRTRLEGTTWYEIDMFPQAYWTQWSDMLVHAIHDRVLRHIKARTEA